MNNLGSGSGVTGNTTQNAGQEDYVDKGLDAAEKKFGVQNNRNMNEKITDGARGLFEKATGKKVPDKVSN